MTEEEILGEIPPPEEGSVFTLKEVVKTVTPHPYCITPTHIKYSDGILDEHSIKRAEGKGARCGTARCDLPFSEHKNMLTLMIEVPDNKNLEAIPGLGEYLLAIKNQAEALGIEAFGFPRCIKNATS